MELKTHYDRQGRPKSRGHYKNGRPCGEWESWYDDGTLMQKGAYNENGLPDGQWEYCWQNGQKQCEGCYQDGKKVGLWRHWDAGGQMTGQGHYTENYRDGLWQHWDSSGELIESGGYVNGRRHGSWYVKADPLWPPFEMEWYHGKPTNRPGKAAEQPQNDRNLYYPVVPGQLSECESPFAETGFSSGLYFGCLSDGSRFTYLFKPVAPLDQAHGGGLFWAVWERYQYLWVVEKRFTASPFTTPKGPKPKISPHSPQHFLVMSNPRQRTAKQRFPASEHQSLPEAIDAAQKLARRLDGRVVVGQLFLEAPLDI